MHETKIKDKSLIATARDITYAKYLAGNDKGTREKAVKSLRKWLQQRNDSNIALNETDFKLIWKGLFYSMWMSDKLLVQEECAENIASLVHCLNVEQGLLFFKVGLKTMCNEWFGIDQLRLDKFFMLIRRLVRHALQLLKENKWKVANIQKFGSSISETILDKKKAAPLGLILHFSDVYMEEIAKVTEGQVHSNTFTEFLVPFVTYLASCHDERQLHLIKQRVFQYLMEQSEIGLKFKHKFQVWRNLGFPGGHINALQKAKNDDSDDGIDNCNSNDEESMTALDPRAGRVNVTLPQIKFSVKNVIKLLRDNKFNGSNTKSRKYINQLIKQFEELSKGQFPLGTKKVELFNEKTTKSTTIRKSAQRLLKFDNKIHGRGSEKRKLTALPEDDAPKIKKQKKIASKNIKKNLDASSSATKKLTRTKSIIKTTSNEENEEGETIVVKNSGTWYVYDDKETKSSVSSPSPKAKASAKASANANCESSLESNFDQKGKLFKVTDSEWNRELQDGETEIFVPSKAYLSKYNSKTLPPLVSQSIKLIKGKDKRRNSMDPKLLFNPFANSTPKDINDKKVKINLKLNRSQEFVEHISNLRHSPVIPFDANKKPEKPVIKTGNLFSSPINPFYKRKSR